MPKQSLLRPEFTRKLAERLLQGGHINLISPHGLGRRRTLQDLQCLLADSLAIQKIDLWRDNIELSTWLTQFSHTRSPTLLILHNFHCVYDSAVFEQLDLLKNNKNLICLYVSEKALPNSPLDAENLFLPSLKAGNL